MVAFYALYSPIVENVPQAADNLDNRNVPQAAEHFDKNILFSIPWDHHRRIIDKCKSNVNKAIFFVRKTLENNWSRNVLLNWLDTGLYEREGKAVSNFENTQPASCHG